jgi:hypothetical protein
VAVTDIRARSRRIQQNLSRFARVTDDRESEDMHASARAGEARSLTTLGYVHEVNFKLVYLFHDAGWAEVLRGFDTREAAKLLIEAGYLWPGEGNRAKRKVRVGGQSPRFYTVDASILEFDEEAGPAGTE